MTKITLLKSYAYEKKEMKIPFCIFDSKLRETTEKMLTKMKQQVRNVKSVLDAKKCGKNVEL